MSIYRSIVIFLIAAGLSNLPYKKEKGFLNVNWKKVILLSALFLISSSILIITAHKNIFAVFSVTPIIIFLTTTVIWFVTPLLVRRYGAYPKKYFEIENNNLRFIAKLEPKTMTIKFFEVIFQQASFLYIFFEILNNLQFETKIWLFTLLVAIFHLGNIFFMQTFWTLFYTFLSIPMALIFSYLLNNGLVLLTASIHLFFYIVFNVRYWFMKKYR